MSLLDELLKQAMQPKKALVQNDVPGGLLAMLTQNNQAAPQSDMAAMVMNNRAPQLQMPEMPQYQGGSGLGKGIISSLLGEWFDERKYTKDAERAEAEKKRQAEELKQIFSSGKTGKDLYYELAKARSPVANKIAEKGLEPLDPEKTKIVEMGVPGEPGMRQQARFDPATNSLIPIGAPWKPSSGVSVYTGDGTMMAPATAEEKVKWGINPDVPATKNNKTGEVVAKPNSMTEDQGKAGMNVEGLETAMANMQEVLKTKTMDPSQNKQDYVGDVLQSTGIPLVKDIGNTMKSVDQQKFDQSKAQLITSIVHLLSGQGFTGAEIEEKLKAFTPIWGEDPKVTTQKFEALAKQAASGKRRAGQTSPTNRTPSLELPPPVPGTELGGFIFIGGDPAKQESWRPK